MKTEERKRPTWLFVVAAISSGVFLLWMGRGLTFFSDEWAFIETRSLFDPGTWFTPHNEHWSTIPIILYRGLMEVFGLRTYVPYLAMLIALHVLVAAAVFVLLRDRVSPWLALGGSIVILLFGSGFENLFWAFQIGFVGSVAAGLWTLRTLDGTASPPRAVGIVILLLVGLATSGLSLVFLGIVGVEMALERRWRPYLAILVLPIVVYATWYLAIGRTGIGLYRDPYTLASLAQIPGFVSAGLGNSVGAITGLGPQIGLVVGWAGVVVVAIRTSRGHLPSSRAVALGAGIVAEYALIALARAGVTAGQVDYTRYTYLGGILALLIIGELLRGVRLPTTGRAGRATVVIAVLALDLALVWNVRLLIDGREFFLRRAELTRALVADALGPLPAGVDPTKSLVIVPSPDSLARIIARYGSPVTDALIPDEVPPTPADIASYAAERLRGTEVGP